jgi:formylglycine-generating enzyme required for sulfatase activity
VKPAVVLLVAGCGAGCGAGAMADRPAGRLGPQSAAADAAMLAIPAGPFIAGSTDAEREAAYVAASAFTHDDYVREHHWFEQEAPRHTETLGAFRIDRMPVSMSEYGEAVAAGVVPGPFIDGAAWQAQGLKQDYSRQVERYVWSGGRPVTADYATHPVVLVTWEEARRYCAWRGRRLPTAAEYEKAARGADGRVYPWGDAFDATRLNTGTTPGGDTTPVGSFPRGASPYGVLDAAGNVFEWTSTPWRVPGQYTVKGSSWEDPPGVGRGASQHGRAATLRLPIVGFRCAGDAGP